MMAMAKVKVVVADAMRHLGTAFALLSLLLCLSVGGLWAAMRAGPRFRILHLASMKLDGGPQSHYSIQASLTGISFSLDKGLPTSETGPYTSLMGPYMPRDGTVTPAMVAWREEVGGFVHSFGQFVVACVPNVSQSGRYQVLHGRLYVIKVPYYALVVLFALPPVVWTVFYGCRRRIAYRVSKGLCRRCGYDLRASKERCPECGMAIPAERVVEGSAMKREDI